MISTGQTRLFSGCSTSHFPPSVLHSSRPTFHFLLSLLALGLLTGCSSLPKGPAGTYEPDLETVQSGIAVAAQYRRPTAPGALYLTAEVYLTNRGTNAVEFTTAVLNGQELITMESGQMLSAMDAVAQDGKAPAITPQERLFARGVNWWQFYPCPTAAPGETVVLQINYRNRPEGPQALAIRTGDGREIKVGIPAFRMPDKAITAITYETDYSRMYVQYDSPKASVRRFWVNGLEVMKHKVLRGATREEPAVLAFKPPVKLKTGMPVCVKLQFKDHTQRYDMVRAFSGILLDAFFLPEDREKDLRKELNLDPDPAVRMVKTVGGDAICEDVHRKQDGLHAMPLSADRLANYLQDSSRLSVIHFCTAEYGGQWDLYGAVMDGAFSNPYTYGVREEERIRRLTSAARPRPFFWMPKTFKQKQAEQFPVSSDVQAYAWLSFVRGSKGISYFAYEPLAEDGFSESPELLEGIRYLNKQICRQKEKLSSLIFISETPPEPLGDGIRQYTAWVPGKGMLILVWNPDVPTAGSSGGEEAKHSPVLGQAVEVMVQLPPWLGRVKVEDLLTGRRMRSTRPRQSQQIRIELCDMATFRMLWVTEESLWARWFSRT